MTARPLGIELELAETWCERCPAAATDVVDTTAGRHYLCADHGAMLRFQIRSANFNGGSRRPKGSTQCR